MSDDRQRIEAAWHLLTHPTLHDAHGNGLVRCDAVAEALTGPQEGTGATQSDEQPESLQPGDLGRLSVQAMSQRSSRNVEPRERVTDSTVAGLLAAAPKWDSHADT